MIMIYVLLVMLFFIIGLLVGKYIFKQNVVEVYDNFIPKEKRNENQIIYDSILQLQNEIAKSGCMRMEKNDDGSYLISLRMVK